MRVIGEKNPVPEDVHVFDFLIPYLLFPQKSICSELAKRFSISIEVFHLDKSTIVRDPATTWVML